MGQEKEKQLEREEQVRMYAKKCGICGQPLLATHENSSGFCSGCQKATND